MAESGFNAGLPSYIWLIIWTSLVNLFTAGLAYPWTMCARYGWRINNLVIDGYSVRFDGHGGQLFGMWLRWWLLIIVTLGIYAFWVPIKLVKWQASHTHFYGSAQASATVAQYAPAQAG